MTKEERKMAQEIAVFLKFVNESRLPIDPKSVEPIHSNGQSKPDILCSHQSEGLTAFELTELCNEDIARAIAIDLQSGGATFLYTSDTTEQRVLNKIQKRYEIAYPVELLCYLNGRSITPDDNVIFTIEDAIRAKGLGPFRRIWFWGENVCKQVGKGDDA